MQKTPHIKTRIIIVLATYVCTLVVSADQLAASRSTKVLPQNDPRGVLLHAIGLPPFAGQAIDYADGQGAYFGVADESMLQYLPAAQPDAPWADSRYPILYMPNLITGAVNMGFSIEAATAHVSQYPDHLEAGSKKILTRPVPDLSPTHNFSTMRLFSTEALPEFLWPGNPQIPEIGNLFPLYTSSRYLETGRTEDELPLLETTVVYRLGHQYNERNPYLSFRTVFDADFSRMYTPPRPHIEFLSGLLVDDDGLSRYATAGQTSVRLIAPSGENATAVSDFERDPKFKNSAHRVSHWNESFRVKHPIPTIIDQPVVLNSRKIPIPFSEVAKALEARKIIADNEVAKYPNRTKLRRNLLYSDYAKYPIAIADNRFLYELDNYQGKIPIKIRQELPESLFLVSPGAWQYNRPLDELKSNIRRVPNPALIPTDDANGQLQRVVEQVFGRVAVQHGRHIR